MTYDAAKHAMRVATDSNKRLPGCKLTPAQLQTLQADGYDLQVMCNGTCPYGFAKLPGGQTAGVSRYHSRGYTVHISFAARRAIRATYPTLQAAQDAVDKLQADGPTGSRALVRFAVARGFADCR